MSAKYRLPVIFGQNSPTQQSHGLCDSWAFCKWLARSECQRHNDIKQ